MLIWGECLKEMAKLPDKSVDMCLTDPPYGTTACKWDTVIPLEPMWEQLHRLVKDNGAICLFGSEPFSSALRMSNIKNYRYDWIWIKNKITGALLAKKRPMRSHEKISVFSAAPATNAKKQTLAYYPQGLQSCKKLKRNRKQNNAGFGFDRTSMKDYHLQKHTNYPKDCIYFESQHGFHETQKPVALLEYLIKTYTLEGETVLDFTMGSGSTGVACANLNREFIGIEKEKKYYDISVERIEKAKAERRRVTA